MAAPGEIDHVLQGIEALPEKGRGDVLVRYLSVYLAAYNDQEEVQQTLIQGLLQWSTDAPTFSFIYDLYGSILDAPRPDGFSDVDYRFILLARTRVRRSAATLNNVLRVCEFLARGFEFIVQPIVPKAWAIVFFDLGLTDQEKGLYERILFDTIGACDALDLTFGSSGTAIYDDATAVYDVGLYA